MILFALLTFSTFMGFTASRMARRRLLETEKAKQEYLLRSVPKRNKIPADLATRIQSHISMCTERLKKEILLDQVQPLALLTGHLMAELHTEAIGEAASFEQCTMLTSGRDFHKSEAVRLVRDLAQKVHSGALVQLASQMTLAMQSSDTFEMEKGLIPDMIAKLESEAGADATKKAFCVKESAESNAKKFDKTDQIMKPSTKIEQHLDSRLEDRWSRQCNRG